MSEKYYMKNKEKWREYYQNKKNNPEYKQSIKAAKIKYRQSEKGKEKKKIDDAKYYCKKKNDPEYRQKRIEYMTKYNKKNRERQKRLMAKHRAKPEVKKKNAKYNKKYYQEHPEVLLRNIRNHLTRLGAANDLKWYQFIDYLKSWSRIVHNDCNQICRVCLIRPSKEAHHILHKSIYPRLAFNRNNGIALCVLCHNQAHGKMLLMNITPR